MSFFVSLDRIVKVWEVDFNVLSVDAFNTIKSQESLLSNKSVLYNELKHVISKNLLRLCKRKENNELKVQQCANF